MLQVQPWSFLGTLLGTGGHGTARYDGTLVLAVCLFLDWTFSESPALRPLPIRDAGGSSTVSEQSFTLFGAYSRPLASLITVVPLLKGYDYSSRRVCKTKGAFMPCCLHSSVIEYM